MAQVNYCLNCEEELNASGGILLSPQRGNVVDKFHLCPVCYAKILNAILNGYFK